MTANVVADISMSLDGYVTGPDPGPKNGLGTGGEPLHDWAINSDNAVDAAVLRDATERTGAVVMGRRLFDIIDGPDGWNDEMGYGAGHAANPPFFVVTHALPDTVRLQLDFTFVTDGVARAIDLAQSVAGVKAVVVMGGADVVRQCVVNRLVDELTLHLSPIVLGGGTPLFRADDHFALQQQDVRVSPTATHLTYRIAG
jgi:dihydrofolate reductase